MALTVKRTAVRRIVYGLLSSVLLCGFAAADTPAPQFTARTLDGQTFTNDSLRGNVVLLQFWTTWCPVCHADQAAVDSVRAAFAGSGLVVLAVDDGEPEALVRRYLQASPRSCAVVATGDRSLAVRFGVHSYPHYVVIDRGGNVAAASSGGGGEAHLRYLLSRAGLPSKTETVQAGNQRAPVSPSVPQPMGASPKLINVPPAHSAALAKPIPKTVFVFTDGEQLEAENYTLYSNFLHVTAEGQDRSIPISALDLKKTIALNHERGINLKIPTSGNEVFLAF
jgi:cytochrome c biogenesis protein CcmG, thiol:disulfide interchange protein DsbE